MTASPTRPANPGPGPVPVRRIHARLQKAIIDLAECIEVVDADERVRVNALPALLRRLDKAPDGIKQQLAAVIADLGQRCNRIIREQWPEGQRGKPRLTVEHVGTLEVSSTGGSTVWEGTRLAYRIAARAADMFGRFDPETGEPRTEPVPPGALAEFVAAELIACAGLDTSSQSWRVGELDKRNISANDYREKSGESRPSVKWA